jgi:hypothetical protein
MLAERRRSWGNGCGHLGAHDAQVTQYTGDGGIDVASRRCIAQVKHYAGSVGVAAIREAGVASSMWLSIAVNSDRVTRHRRSYMPA